MPLQRLAFQRGWTCRKGHDVFRYSNSDEFLKLLRGAGLTEVNVREHAATYCVPIRKPFGKAG